MRLHRTFANEARPAKQAAILLATYDFTNANKLFGYHLINSAPDKDTGESPFSSFLSLTSYLLHHAYRSPRAGYYAELSLFTLRILSEDSTSCKLLCSDESKRKVRLCRQRQPYLPLVTGDRVLATAVFDILVDAISHNLRRRLDVQLYRYDPSELSTLKTVFLTYFASHTIAILLRILTYLSMNRIRLHYHWSELWRTLLSLMRFLTTYVSDLTTSPHINTLTTSLVDLVAFCVAAGDTFLPDPASYDDLFYKLVETGPIIAKFRDVYSLKPSTTASSSALSKPVDSNKDIHIAAVETLISVSTHFYALLFNPGTGPNAESTPTNSDGDAQGQTPTPIPAAQKKNLSPREVHRIIKQGYDTLSIQPPEGLSAWTRYRETDWKPELKRAARCAVDDATHLVA